MTEEWQRLYDAAKSVINFHRLSEHMSAGDVGAAVLSAGGNIYTGVCLDVECSLGFCAERNAISTMFTHGEYEITKVCAVYMDGGVIPPLRRLPRIHDADGGVCEQHRGSGRQ